MAYIGREPTVGNFQVCDAISVVNGQAAYTMQVGGVNVSPETANHMLVSLNGVLQAPGSSYTVSGSTITFASNLVTGDVIDFIHILGSVLDLGVPSNDTVGAAQIKDDLISGTTALASEPADTDEFLVSDAGTLKRIDYSLIKGGGSVTLIKTLSGGDSTSSLTFLNGSSDVVFDNTYDQYILRGSRVQSTTDNQYLRIQFINSSGTITSGYKAVSSYFRTDGSSVTKGDHTQTSYAYEDLGAIRNTNDEYLFLQSFIGGVGHNISASIQTASNYTDSSNRQYLDYSHSTTDAATTVTGLYLHMSSGNIRGEFSLYGVKK